MSFTLCSSGAIVRKAGLNLNSTAAASAALIAAYADEAEAEIVGQTRFDWVAGYASVATNLKPLLASACSNLAAMKLISYDMNSYTTTEMQTMLDYLSDEAEKNIAILKEADANKIRSL